jgi:transketolase
MANSLLDPLTTPELAQVASTIRGMAMDMVATAANGHAGAPLGLADVASVMFFDVLRFDPVDPTWHARDRFILSNGHASALLYACLHLAGYRISLDDLRRFRQLNSVTAGHPEFGLCPGVEVTTGPLGQGFATAVGIAMAQRLLAGRFPSDASGFTPATGRTFVICSDGDLMEGVSSESLQLAGAWGLGNLVAIYDSNGVTIDGCTSNSWVEDVAAKFQANQWRVLDVFGNDLTAIRSLLNEVATYADVSENCRPTLVIANTTIAFGSPKRAGSHTAHWGPLDPEEDRQARIAFGLPDDSSFYISESLSELLQARAQQQTKRAKQWQEGLAMWRQRNPVFSENWDAHFEPPQFSPEQQRELIVRITQAEGEVRSINEHCGNALNVIAEYNVRLVGGSADLAGSTSSPIRSAPFVRDETGMDFSSARNIHLGVREHAGAAIANGLTLHRGFQGFLSSFLAFSDYCRPAIRMAALMRIPSIFYFTHDSVLLGPDGPTHQPIEHLWSLRLIPNLKLFRPADAAEAAIAWKIAAEARIPSGPMVIAASPKPLPVIRRPQGFDYALLAHGGYVLAEQENAHLTLAATGSEVTLAIETRQFLFESGILVRIVSLPCLELFAEQPAEYQASVLRPRQDMPLVTLEAGSTAPWHKYLTTRDLAIGIDEFGVTASWADIAPHFGLTGPQVAKQIIRHFKL